MPEKLKKNMSKNNIRQENVFGNLHYGKFIKIVGDLTSIKDITKL